MWREITQGIKQVAERLSNSVVGIVGFGVATQGKGGLKSGLIVAEHLESARDAWARRRMNDLVD